MYEVVKKFKYAPNIYKTLDLKKGNVLAINETAVDGLLKDGFIKPSTAKPPEAKTETKAVNNLEQGKPTAGLKTQTK